MNQKVPLNLPPPMFDVDEPFMGITVVKLNEPFRELFVQFLDEIEDEDGTEKQIIAFRYALKDAARCRQMRAARRQKEKENTTPPRRIHAH